MLEVEKQLEGLQENRVVSDLKITKSGRFSKVLSRSIIDIYWRRYFLFVKVAPFLQAVLLPQLGATVLFTTEDPKACKIIDLGSSKESTQRIAVEGPHKNKA